jgi:peptidyl-prolyl cis-trans isomerase A (cyclophilin A)
MVPFKSNMKRLTLLILTAALFLANNRAATIATIKTSVGAIELELYDEDKPITVSNFIKYAQSGRYRNSFLHRWVTNFVFQGGGFFITNTAAGKQIADVPTDPPIFNEYGVGRTFSNVYGTIAMARSAETNSATSQWFINVNNNAFLDLDKGGFTVFGRVISGTNVVNLFIQPEGTQGINIFPLNQGVFRELPVFKEPPDYDDLIYTEISLRREVNLKISRGRTGKTLSWDTVAGVTNIVEYTTNFAPQWHSLTNVRGTGNRLVISDGTTDRSRAYRVRLLY